MIEVTLSVLFTKPYLFMYSNDILWDECRYVTVLRTELACCVKWQHTHTHVDTYFSSERFLQNHHFVQDAAQCPDVSSLVIRLTFAEFRCQVARSSKHGQKLCLPAACDNSNYHINVPRGNEIRLFETSVKEGSVGRVCSTHGGGWKCVQGFCGETWRHHIEDGNVILKWILKQ